MEKQLKQRIDAERHGWASIEQCRFETSKLVGRTADANALRYDMAVKVVDPTGAGRDKVTAIAEKIGNVGPLREGLEVLVLRGDTFVKYQVKGLTEEKDVYRLAQWQVMRVVGSPYIAGYALPPERCDSWNRCEPEILIELPRSKIYAGQKIKQEIADCPAQITPYSLQYLVLLFRDAEIANNEVLKPLASAMVQQVNERLGRNALRALTASLKRSRRITEKVYIKYGGDYSKVSQNKVSTSHKNLPVDCRSLTSPG